MAFGLRRQKKISDGHQRQRDRKKDRQTDRQRQRKVVVCGHGLVTLSLTINETLKWLSSLPILMQVILVVTG